MCADWRLRDTEASDQHIGCKFFGAAKIHCHRKKRNGKQPLGAGADHSKPLSDEVCGIDERSL